MPCALAIYPRSVQTQILNFLMTVIYWWILDTIILSVSPNDTIPTTTAFDQRNKNHMRRVRSYVW